MDKRCDKKTDCEDGTDEQSCDMVKLNEDNYRKTNVPVNNYAGKQEIAIWFDVMDIAEVNEPEVRQKLSQERKK